MGRALPGWAHYSAGSPTHPTHRLCASSLPSETSSALNAWKCVRWGLGAVKGVLGGLGLQEGTPRTQGGVSRLHWKYVSRPEPRATSVTLSGGLRPPGAGGCGSPDTPSCSQGSLPSTPRSTHDTTAASQELEVTRRPTWGQDTRAGTPAARAMGPPPRLPGLRLQEPSHSRSPDLRPPPRPPRPGPPGADSPPGDSLGQWCSAPAPQGLQLCLGRSRGCLPPRAFLSCPEEELCECLP